MITWMQRHQKYLIITIWISTIAFVGAGFVGWGQYSYGDKAGAIAKVGNIEISQGELQETYSTLYSQYNQMFQGNFDEERAKSFGLQKQALNQLQNQALLLNLASEYNLAITDKEILDELKTQKYFFKDGFFDKEVYKQALSRTRVTIKEYEANLRKQLLIEKVLKLFPVKTSKNEEEILNTIVKIADKIEYKILSKDVIKVDSSDKVLKPYWELSKQNYMTEIAYKLNVIKQKKVSKEYEETKISEYYKDNKNHFKDDNGKILPLEKAKDSVISELNAKATKDLALRTYISYKKGKLSSDVKVDKITLTQSNNKFNNTVLEKVSKLKLTSPYLKPILVDEAYYIFELTKIVPSKVKSFEEAKELVRPIFITEERSNKLLDMAKNSMDTFKGTITDFITNSQTEAISNLNSMEANEFLTQLFTKNTKRGYISLTNGDIVLFNILEQKLLNKENKDQSDSILKLKTSMFNEGLIKNLNNKYKTTIFIEGL